MEIVKEDVVYNDMRKFIEEVELYLKTQTDDVEMGLNKLLQLLRASVNINFWNSDSIILTRFYSNLYQLISSISEGSILLWSCVDILSVICGNFHVRNMLINTYHFLPPLSSFLGDHLKQKEKIKLLNLMRELSYGIKINWHIPRLSHLISTLVKWITTKKDETLQLCLVLLNNLCYKNVSAFYTLTRCINLKEFIHSCSLLTGVNVPIEAFKLLIILDDFNGEVSQAVILKFIKLTFESIMEAFNTRNYTQLQHTNAFFLDVFEQRVYFNSFMNSDYENLFIKLLQEFERVLDKTLGDSDTFQYFQSVESIFEFLYIIMTLIKSKPKHFYKRLIKVCLYWIELHKISPQAVLILQHITINIKEDEFDLLEPLTSQLSIFISPFEKHYKEECISQVEYQKYLSHVMEILKVLVRTKTTRQSILTVLKEDDIKEIFKPFLSHDLNNHRSSIINNKSIEIMILYVNIIGLLNEIVKYDCEWNSFYKTLMTQREIQTLLAEGLMNGPHETKLLILNISSNELFPANEIAQAMCKMHPCRLTDMKPNTEQYNDMLGNVFYPLTSITIVNKLEEVISKLREGFKNDSIINLPTSDIMELYEYKLSIVNQAERTAIASLEIASRRCTELQHQNAQFTVQLSQFHQRLLQSVRDCEDVVKEKENVIAESQQLKENLLAEIQRYKSEIVNTKKLLDEKSKQFEDTSEQLECTKSTVKNLEKDIHQMTEQEQQLRKNIEEQTIENANKEEQNIKLNSMNDDLKNQIANLQERLRNTEMELNDKIQELSIVTQKLNDLEQILQRISELSVKTQ